MEKLRCQDCEEIFDHEDAGARIEVEHDQAWGQLTQVATTILLCPASGCGSENIDEHISCDTAGCTGDVLFGTEQCAPCFRRDDETEFESYCIKWPHDVEAKYRPAAQS